MSSQKGKSKMRNSSKSIPNTLESEIVPAAPSDEETEMEISQLSQPETGSGVEDNDSDGWSSSDEQVLVKNIRQFTKKSDKLKYNTRLQRLDWSKIAFKKYSAKECQGRFAKYLKMVRTYRTLPEILSDVEEEIKRIPFKKPLNSYQLFVQDQLSNAQSSGDFANRMRNLATMYKNLSPIEREKYDKKSKEALDDYNKKKMEYLAEKNPDTLKTPFFLFSEHFKLNELNLNATQMKHKYEELPQNEKYKWVEKAVKLNAGISVTSFLNKDEQRLYRGLPKSVGTPYSMFVKDMYTKVKEFHEEGVSVFTEIAQKWKNLSPNEKEKYKKACAKLKEEAVNETKAINDRFGVKVIKKKKIATKTKKHKSSEIVESDDENDEDENKKGSAAPQKSAQKRKMSSTNESSEEPHEVKRTKKDKSIKVEEKEFASPAPVTSTPHIKSKKRTNTITSEDIVDEDMTTAMFMVQIPMSHVNDDQSDSSTGKKEKEKKKKSEKSPEKKLNNTIRDSEAEVSTSSSKSGSKKKKKNDKSPVKSSNRPVQDSEAEASAGSSVSESKQKKKVAIEESNGVPPPGERPPSSLLEFYAKYVYSGKRKPHKVQKSFDKLTQKEKKELTAQHNEKVEKYVGQLKSYLGSLTKEQAILYVAQVKNGENARKSQNNESQVY